MPASLPRRVSLGGYATFPFGMECTTLVNHAQVITWRFERDVYKLAFGLPCRHAMESPPVARFLQLQAYDTGYTKLRPGYVVSFETAAGLH